MIQIYWTRAFTSAIFLLMNIKTNPKLEYLIVHSKEIRFSLQKDFAMATLARIEMRGITTIAEPRL